MENIKISVIVPVYNTPEENLSHCMASILAQTHHNLEILLIDDGSCLRTAEMLDRYSENDDRIRVIHSENHGLSLARTMGLNESTGEFVIFVDSDDMLAANSIEYLLFALISTNSDMALANLKLVSEYFEISECADHKYNISSCNSIEALERLIVGDDIGSSACCRLAAKEIWGNSPFIPGRIHEDLASMWQVFDNCNKIAICQDSLYYYYLGGESNIHKRKNSEKFCIDFWLAFTERRNAILHLHPELKEADAYSCLVYCPQIYSAILKSNITDKLLEIKKQCKTLFKESWKSGKEYAEQNNKKWLKYTLFRISPKIYHCVYVLWRRIQGKRL